jgi:hypothetical protein
MNAGSYIEKFERVVNLLRTTGDYVAMVTGDPEVYEVVSTVRHYLSVNDYITLAGVKVRVVTVIDDYTVEVNVFSQAVDANGTWQALAPYSMYGTRVVINQMLMDHNAGEYAYQKYPLVALRLPATVTVNGATASLSANILIAHFTGATLRPQERLEQKFEAILWPLTSLFLKMVRYSGEFNIYEPEYQQVDRMFYGNETGEENIKNVFDDPLDAVELRGLKLSYSLDGCSTPSIQGVGGFEYLNEHVFES